MSMLVQVIVLYYECRTWSCGLEVRVICPTIIYRSHLKISAAIDDMKLYIIIQINSHYS
jgi:hypothetical protein